MTKKVLKFTGEKKELTIDNIIPYELNNKIHGEKQVDLLANIIGKYWYVDEIIVDKNNIIIAWHGRLESAKKMWYEAVEVKVMDIDIKDSRAFRILHNKISNYDSEDNLENLVIELSEINSDDLDWLNVTMEELYPDLDAPEYNPDDYDTWNSEESNKTVIKVSVDSPEMAEVLVESLKEMWYNDVKIL